MNYNALEQEIEKATKIAFKELFEKHKEEEIYSFALYSDGGAMTVCPSSNTLSFLNDLSEEEKKEIDYYKFEPAEWKYEGIGADEEFDKICSNLYEERAKSSYGDQEKFLNFRTQVFNCCINVLKRLNDENFFQNIISKEIFLIFSVSDFEFEETVLVDIVSKLNNNQYKTEYLNWLKSNKNQYDQ